MITNSQQWMFITLLLRKMKLSTRSKLGRKNLTLNTFTFYILPFTFYISLSVFLPVRLTGQQAATTPILVRPLENLIEDALEHSPLLDAQDLNADIIHEKIKILNREWGHYFALTGTYQFGNIRFLDNLDNGGVIDFRTITRENTFYSAGVSFRVPLSDLVTKSNRRSILEHQLKQEQLLKQDKELQLRELVIRQYHELQLQMQLLRVKSKELDFHTVNVELAEKFFREGQMDLDAYTSSVVKMNQAEQEVVEARVKMQLAYQVLKEVVGREIKAINE